MTGEQWRTAWRIVSSARELAAGEQRAFIDSQTSDPEVLLRVIELVEVSPEEELPATRVDRTGSQVGRYQVAGLLGRGGMSEVYAARDTDLDRPVALKFLVAGMGDPSTVKRFVREARAASALNHPNILTVHEVIQSPSGLAIAMELVEGKAVSEFRGAALRIPQVVALGRQVASALAAAHEQRIVHRDIKPENLMVRPDGFVKVLDFGLAHDFAGQLAATLQPSAAALPAGTLRYMSPEQLREEPITGASDVFSLGIVLYELAAGRHPFESEYAWETAYAIHTRDPAPLSTVNREVPAWLDELILSMLERDSGLRPSAEQVESALLRSTAGIRSRGRRSRAFLTRLFQSSARRMTWALAVMALVAYAWISRRDVPADANLKFIPLTTFGGSKQYPAFSRDGSRIAFSWRASNTATHHIYVKPVAHGDPVQLTFGSEEDAFPSWSPDGRHIAFCRRKASADKTAPVTSGAYIVPSSGGADRRIGESCAGVSWSPDGNTLALARTPDAAADSGGIDVLSLESGVWRRLTSSREDLLPSFSPNGNWIAFIRVLPGRGRGREIFVVPSAGGQPRQLTFDGEYTTGVTWTADSREIVFSSPRNRTQGSFWRMPVSGGAPRPVSAALRNVSYPSISPLGSRMAFTESASDSNIHLRTGAGFPRGGTPWRFDAPIGVVLSTGTEHSPAFSPGGERFAFVSDRTGNNEIWISPGDGGDAIQLTSFGNQSTGSPAWSPDGAWIAFDVWASNQSNVYVISSRGGTPRRVSLEPGESWTPAWSPDGRWIYFTSDRSGSRELWKMPAAGGASIQITHTGALEGRPSRDGQIIYVRKSTPSGCCAIWSVSADGGREEPLRGLERFAISRSWGVLEEGIYFIASPNERRQTVRFLSFARHEVADVVSLEREPDWSFPGLAISPDGRYLLSVQIDREANDLMMIENFR